MEHGLHPWGVFGVLPVFAFATAGVPLIGMPATALLDPVPLGIALGLFLGKQLGVFGTCWIAVKSNIARLPAGVTWPQVYGMALPLRHRALP